MDASAGAGSGNAPCAGAGASSCCYYTLLGIRKNASSTDIRAAYRRLAMVRALLSSAPPRAWVLDRFPFLVPFVWSEELTC
uniref:J domain-containing protein n=1 Tax=Triticum urartu TaxID=4572 RepID=A0A8R7Q5J7_TRIUA